MDEFQRRVRILEDATAATQVLAGMSSGTLLRFGQLERGFPRMHVELVIDAKTVSDPVKTMPFKGVGSIDALMAVLVPVLNALEPTIRQLIMQRCQDAMKLVEIKQWP
jgi:hypothetical protein